MDQTISRTIPSMAKAHLEKISCEQIDFADWFDLCLSDKYLPFILAKQANVETLKSGLSQSTVIYDKKNEEAGTLYAQKGHT